MGLMGFIPSAGVELEGVLANLLTPLGVTGGQWADMQRGVDTTPEKRLLLAILEDALHIVRQGVPISKKKRATYDEAMGWLMGEGEVDEQIAFSCEGICDHLGINVGLLRKVLQAGKLKPTFKRASHTVGRPTKAEAIYPYSHRQATLI